MRSSNFFWRAGEPSDRRPVLRLTAAGGGVRYDVRLVGMLNRSRFIVTHPVMPEGALAFVRDGDAFEVGTFDGAQLYRFPSVVRAVRLGEAPSVELTLPPPESRRQEPLRQAHRLSITMPCSVRFGDSDSQVRTGFVADLSHLGARIAVEVPLPAGIERVLVAFRIEVLGRAQTVQAPAFVRSHSDDPRPDMPAHLYGLQFDGVEAQTTLLVSHFVLDRLLAQDEDIFATVR